MTIMHKVTLKTLKKNKTRTIVTIIGVILSAAMITAVTTFITSLQNMLVNSAITTDGRWQAAISQVPFHDLSTIINHEDIKESGIQKTLGYAKMKGDRNNSKPYLFVQEFDQKSMELYAFHLKEGRMPENNTEIMISEQTFISGGVPYSLGDTITLDIGNRVDKNGATLTQDTRDRRKFCVKVNERLPFRQELG